MNPGVAVNKSRSGAFSIAEVVALAETGHLRVPSFQRSFVWGGADVRDLFDSLYRGFPVGTLLLWEREGRAGEVAFGPLRLEVPERTDAYWVVDGQQRVTSLVGALSEIYLGADERFDVYFDLATERFINPRRGIVPPRAMPVREALETKSLLTWLRLHSPDLESRDFDVADRLGAVFREYKIPVYIVTGSDERLLREVFDRVNSAGKPISRAEVFHALFANEAAPGSPASVAAALQATGFGVIPENRVVQGLLGIRGGDVQRDMRNEFSASEDPIEWYDKVEVAFSGAIEFLKAQGVYHSSLMPNTLPLPVLATFFHVHPEPSPWILRLLARWLWRGWVHGFGKEGGQTPVLRRAIRSIYPDKGNLAGIPDQYRAVQSLLSYVPDREVDSVIPKNFRTDRAESRLVLLALASLGPRDGRGESLDIARLFNEFGMAAVSEFVDGHRTVAAARGFWRPDSPPIATAEDRDVFESHAISVEAELALKAGSCRAFLLCRERDLERIVRNYLMGRLEVNAIVRPPLQDLVVAGSEDDG